MKTLNVFFTAALLLSGASAAPLKIFILAGQSNMAGRGDVVRGYNHSDRGHLEWAVETYPEKYGHLKDANGDWVVREDVWIWCQRTNKNLDAGWGLLKQPLSVGTGFKFEANWIGPEFGFGLEVGDYFDEQVLIIKHAWGGTAIAHEWRSPSMPDYTEPQVKEDPGYYYKLMFEEIDLVLSDIKAIFPDYDESEGYQIVGFGWHQGFNDALWGRHETYEENLAIFIQDVRAELGIPNLPWVIGASEHKGGTIEEHIKPAQLNLADPQKHPEFEGNLTTTHGDFWRDVSVSPKDDGSHYNWNGETLYLIGEAMGKGMVALLENLPQIRGCMNSAYQEYNPQATINDPDSCITLRNTGIVYSGSSVRAEPQALAGWEVHTGNRTWKEIHLLDIRGRAHYTYQGKKRTVRIPRSNQSGVCIIQVLSGNSKKEFKVFLLE